MKFEWAPLRDAPKDGSLVLARPIQEDDVTDEFLVVWSGWRAPDDMQWIRQDAPTVAINERFFVHMRPIEASDEPETTQGENTP